MIKFLFNILIILLVTFLAEKLAYKHVRKIDKKERKKLQAWELENIKILKEFYGSDLK